MIERDHFREVVGHAGIGIAQVAVDGRWLEVNSAYCDLLGYGRGEMLGRSFQEMTVTADLNLDLEYYRALKAGEIPRYSMTKRYLHKLGHHVWTDLTVTLVRPPDAEVFAVALARPAHDPELKVNEGELRAKMQNASKLNVLGRMAANISHEIKNPLSVIYGSAFRLKAMLEGRVPDSAGRMLDDIQDMSLRIVKMIDGLRGFSREAGRDPFEFVDLRAVLEDVRYLCRPRFARDDLDFDFDPPSEAVFVFGQSIQIQQILLNLLFNAYDAALGEVSRRKRIGLRIDASEDHVKLRVFDNGPGVAAEVRDTLFEPFVTTKRSGRGTGLGLNITREIVLAHRGRIYFERTGGETNFVVELPRVYPPPGTS